MGILYFYPKEKKKEIACYNWGKKENCGKSTEKIFSVYFFLIVNTNIFWNNKISLEPEMYKLVFFVLFLCFSIRKTGMPLSNYRKDAKRDQESENMKTNKESNFDIFFIVSINIMRNQRYRQNGKCTLNKWVFYRGFFVQETGKALWICRKMWNGKRNWKRAIQHGIKLQNFF